MNALKVFFGILLGAFTSSMWWLAYTRAHSSGTYPSDWIFFAIVGTIAMFGFLVASIKEIAEN